MSDREKLIDNMNTISCGIDLMAFAYNNYIKAFDISDDNIGRIIIKTPSDFIDKMSAVKGYILAAHIVLDANDYGEESLIERKEKLRPTLKQAESTYKKLLEMAASCILDIPLKE